MTHRGLKIFVLRALLGAFRLLGYVLTYVSILFLWFFRMLWGGLRRAAPAIFALHRFGFALRRSLVGALVPVRSVFVQFLTHRLTIHLAILVIAFWTMLMGFGTRAVRAEDLGTQSILYALVSGTSEELIEEGLPVGPATLSAEYLVDIVAVGREPAIDFDYIDESYVATITGGSALIAPHPSAGPAAAARTSVATYTVEEGDTISHIAGSFGLSIETVLWANKLTFRSYIRPGDTLTVPPVDGVIHTVKKGDTAAKLARNYNASLTDILAWNQIDEATTLPVGGVLMIPGGRVPAPPARRIGSPSALFAGPRPPGVSAVRDGNLLWPTAARRISQYFGWRHTGLDIAGPTGTAIYAADDGIVEHAGWTRGYGQNLIVNHGNGIKTRYAHNSKNYVSKGNEVRKGEAIAAIGSTGRSTGPHIHFEVIANGRFRNPLEYIR